MKVKNRVKKPHKFYQHRCEDEGQNIDDSQPCCVHNGSDDGALALDRHLAISPNDYEKQYAGDRPLRCYAPLVASISGHASPADFQRHIEAKQAKMARRGIKALD
jgi:hypothetical protein